MNEPNGKPDAIDAGAILEGLERKVTLLVERHEALARDYSDLIETARDSDKGVDPADLEARVRTLQAERDRLARHAEFLESRVRELLTRARYAAGV